VGAKKHRRVSKGALKKRDTESRSPLPARGARRFLPALGVVGLLTVHFMLASTSVRHKGPTFDEVAHLTRGHSWWQLEDRRLLTNHPPLASAWAALPLLDDGLEFPSLNQEAWRESKIFAIAKQFFYRVGNDPDAMLRQARTMMILLSVALGGVVFWWSKRLFGAAGGTVSLVLYAFSPTVLANGRLVTTDLAASLFFLLSAGGVWWVLHRVSPASLLVSAAALAGLFLSKMSAGLIVPMGLALLVIRLLSRRPLVIKLGRERWVTRRWRMALVFVAIIGFCILTVWLALWAAYGFRYQAMVGTDTGRDHFFVQKRLPAGMGDWEFQAEGIPATAAAITWARELHLLPEAYLYGFLFTVQSGRERDAFLDGERRLTGWWYFFPLCFLYKVPLPIMGVILAAVIGVVTGRRHLAESAGATGRSRGRRMLDDLYRTAPLWMLVAVYWVFAMRANLNIGHRHLLPTFAPMFVLCGAAATWLDAGRKWLRAIIPALLGLLVIASLVIWPHYLASFNTVAGGPAKGYRHLVQSSLDWGQDLPGLKRWLDRNRGGERVYVAYHGTGDWAYYGIKASSLPPYLRQSGTGDYRLTDGIYCISATRLQQIYRLRTSAWTEKLEQQYRRLLPEMLEFEQTPNDKHARGALMKSKGNAFKNRFRAFQKLRFGRLCAYLRRRAPDDHVGYSILIYRLIRQDIDAALSEPIPSP